MRTNNSQRGFSIPEAVFAIGIGALAVAGGMVVNQEQLRMVKSTQQTSGASHLLEERVEQLRIANWKQITDAAYLTNTYFKVASKSAKPLGSFVEHITITAFPNADVCTPLELERTEDGTTRVTTGGAGLSEQKLAKVSVGVSWVGSGGRTRVRELATIISNAGISRMNLPAMGAGIAGTAETATTVPTDTTTTTTTPTTGGTTTTTPTDTNNGNGNGNGNGRGNVAGKPGKA